MFTYSQYWKNNDIEKHFKKYAQKWRLGNVSLLTSIRNIFRKDLARSSKCYNYKERTVMVLVFWWKLETETLQLTLSWISLREGDFIKEARNLWILEAATDRRFAKIGFPKSIWSNFLKNASEKSFFSKATGNSPKILLKMNSFTNVFQGFQATDLT